MLESVVPASIRRSLARPNVALCEMTIFLQISPFEQNTTLLSGCTKTGAFDTDLDDIPPTTVHPELNRLQYTNITNNIDRMLHLLRVECLPLLHARRIGFARINSKHGVKHGVKGA